MTNESVPKLFAAGIIPGLLLAGLFAISIIIVATIDPKIAPSVPPEEHTWKIRLYSLKSILPLFALVVLVLGGIYAGIFTPTEAAAIGAIGAFLIAAAFRRASLNLIWDSLRDSGQAIAWIGFILIGTNILSFGLGQSGIAKQSIEAIAALKLSPIAFMSIMMAFYILLGCLIDGLSLVLLSIAVVLPIVKAMGIDTIWFGIMMILMTECSLITPPVGLNLYVIAGVANEPVESVIKGVIPFVLSLFLVIILVMFFPVLALFIPSYM
jgi:tripartite ATP-independent transporter DctM subunit